MFFADANSDLNKDVRFLFMAIAFLTLCLSVRLCFIVKSFLFVFLFVCLFVLFFYCLRQKDKKPFLVTYGNSADPVQSSHNAASYQDLHCLLT